MVSGIGSENTEYILSHAQMKHLQLSKKFNSLLKSNESKKVKSFNQ